MARLTTPAIARQLGSLFDDGSLVGLSDRQLIERFNHRHDEAAAEAAFAALVARHGPMVLGVCRQLLADRHLAEDAFQAVFLVLARKAHALRDPDLLGTWLYGVALRTARKARSRIARQHRHEQGDVMDAVVEPTSPPAEQTFLDRDQAEMLHGEIDRLPAIFRSPIVLCYFEGLTLDEAARQLRCPAGTLRSRLARAREKLGRALSRRGFALSMTVLDAMPTPASVSPHLCDITARAALHFAARQAAASTAATLAQEVLRTMTIHTLRTAIATLLLLVAFAAGSGYLARSLAMGDEPGKAPAVVQTPAAAKPDDAGPRPTPGRMFVVGRVLDPQGKPVANASVMVYAAIKQPGRLDDFQKLRPAAIGQARSDGSGCFRLDAQRTTSARHHRFGAVALAPGYGAGWVALDPDDDQPGADVTLKPEQVIEGRLFDVNGRPVRDVEVTVQTMVRIAPARLGTFVPESTDGPSFSPIHGTDLPGWPRPALSNAAGRFTLRGIGRGLRVVLGIHDPRFARLSASIDTDDPSRSKSVNLALEPARIIAGRVTDAETGRPVPHARLRVLSYKANAGAVNDFEADGQGRFRMNPLSADRYSISASPPSGQPYLNAQTGIFDWPKGALEHRIDLVLHRGVVIRGKVVEDGSGGPVAGARISYVSRRTSNEATRASNGSEETAHDGSFQLAVLPAPGDLVVLGPSDDYVLQAIGERVVREGQPGGRRFYAHAFIACDPKTGIESPEVRVPLRHGGTVKGHVIGPDGRPILSAAMISRVFLRPYPGVWVFWRYSPENRVRDGRFEIHGLDPEAEMPVHFLEPKSKLGATAMLSGKLGSGGPITVRLEPCGSARARFVDAAGKPVAGFRAERLVWMVITPGAPRGAQAQPGQLIADEAGLSAIDPTHYGDAPVSDAVGRIELPALIPGATYSVRTSRRRGPPLFRKDFTVKPGETVNLGEIVVEKP